MRIPEHNPATNVIATEWFQASLVTYLLLTLAETIDQGTISNYLNLNYLLGIILVSGIVMVVTAKEGTVYRDPLAGGKQTIGALRGMAARSYRKPTAAAPPRRSVATRGRHMDIVPQKNRRP